MIDPYATLELQRGATPEQAKAAFKRLAKTCHPDLHPNNPTAEARFKEINAAYDSIVNPQPQANFQPGGNPFNFEFNFDPGNMFHGRSPFDDLFRNLHAQQRQDLHLEVRMSLEEIFTGKELQVQAPAQTAGGEIREFKIKVPPGIDDGMRLVVQQGGQQSGPNMRPGDLHIIVRTIPHPRFTRQAMNLLTTIPVTAFDVLLGNEIEVVGIDGHSMRVAIPTGFDSTRKLRLAGQGMSDAQGHRGDLLVELFIQYPIIPVDQQTVLRQIAEAVSKQSN
jgi:curved DNA-binding protein